jgi:glycosyltransferase involved in cell wall biosynthesis
MSNLLYIIDDVTGPAEKSSSLAQYQFCLYAVTNHEVTIISRSEINEPSITGQAASVKTAPGGRYAQILTFPLYVILHLILTHAQYDVYATNQSGESILPMLLWSVFDIDWIILSTDSPDGKYIRTDRGNNTSLVAGMYWKAMFQIALSGFSRCDRVILSDETDLIDDTKKTVVKGGADCKKINRIASEQEDYLRQTPEGTVRLVYVGNMYIHRGIDILFEAVEKAESDVELVLIGPGPDAGGPQNAAEFLSRYPVGFDQTVNDLEKPCEYKGVLDHEQTVREIVSADVGLCILPYERGLPHFRTSYPIKVFEYMAAGLPVVCTRTEATGELLSDEQLVSSHDPGDVASKIDKLIHNQDTYQQCSRQNRSVISDYCWDSLWDELDAAFTQVISR